MLASMLILLHVCTHLSDLPRERSGDAFSAETYPSWLLQSDVTIKGVLVGDRYSCLWVSLISLTQVSVFGLATRVDSNQGTKV